MAKHDGSDSRMGFNRLLDAADLILISEAARPDGLTLLDLQVGKGQTELGDHYTCDELVEAMRFLMRLGLVSPRERVEKRRGR